MIKENEKLLVDTFNNYICRHQKTSSVEKHPNFDGQSLSIITDYFKDNEIVVKINKKCDTQEN